MESEESLWKALLSFHYVDAKDWTQLSGLAVNAISPTEPALQALLIFLMYVWLVTIVYWI